MDLGVTDWVGVAKLLDCFRRGRWVLSLVALIWGGTTGPVAAAPGNPDRGLWCGATPVYAVERLGDGRIVIGGGFTEVTDNSISDPIKEVPRSKMARILPDGTLDPGFVPPVFSWGGSAVNSEVLCVAVRTDNKVYVGGQFNAVDGVPSSPLVRLNADGTLDSAFTAAIGGTVHSVSLQSDGQILASNDQNGQGLKRLNTNGTADATFSVNLGVNPAVHAIELYPDGRILIGGDFTMVGPQARTNLAMLNPNGTVSGSLFPVPVQTVRALERAYDGNIYVGGGPDFYNPEGTPLDGLARLLADGSYDSAWTPELNSSAVVDSIREQSDGRLIIAGSFDTVNGATRKGIARLRPDGNADPVFTPPELGTVRSVALLPAGGVFAGGVGAAMKRLHDDGTTSSPGPLFNVAIASNPQFYDLEGLQAVAVLPDARFVVGGNNVIRSEGPSVPTNTLFRFQADGSRDVGFNPPSNIASVSGLAALKDGKLIAACRVQTSNSTDYLYRLLANGIVDTNFASPVIRSIGEVRGLLLQPDDKILAWGVITNAGGVSRRGLVRIHPDGAVDTSFVPHSNQYCFAAALQDDDKLVVAGAFIVDGLTNDVVRLNPDGALDDTFIPLRLTNSSAGVMTLAIQGDGRVLVGGRFRHRGRDNLLRLDAAGEMDTNFMCAAASVTNARQVRSLVLDASGFINVGVEVGPGGGTDPVVQLLPDGAESVSFQYAQYQESPVAALALQRDGGLLAVGERFRLEYLAPYPGVVRLQNAPPAGRLEINAPGQVVWYRSGSAPEAQHVWFELSTDGGMTWNLLGRGVRIPGGWRLSGLALPWSGHIRARARTVGGYHNGSSGIVEQAVPFATRVEVVQATWMEEYYQQPFNPGTATMFSDADFDTFLNLLEFAFNTRPDDATSGWQALSFNGSFFNGGTVAEYGQLTLKTEPGLGDELDRRMLFIRRVDHAAIGLRYVPEFSTDMQTWSEGDDPGTVVGTDEDYEVVSIPLPVATLDSEKQFARIRLAVGP